MKAAQRKLRWICIGTLRSDTMLFNCGHHRRGYWLNWRGRTSWCQPNEFPTIEGVEWAVRKRLDMVRLRVIAFASPPPRKEYQELWVLVRRHREHRERKPYYRRR